MPWAVIAIVSGYSEEITDRAKDYADLVLSKPVHFDKLANLVALTRELINKREAIRKLSDPKYRD